MDVDDERLIQRALRRPDALSGEERRRVEHLIAHDPAAEAYADVLEAYYALLDAEDQRERSPHVDDFVDGLFDDDPPPVVSLRPFRSERDVQSTVLAAATQTASAERRFSVLTTLAAEQDEVLVRVIGDHDTGQGRVYVLADPPMRQAHVIVSFPGLGLDLVTDEEGRQTFDLPSNLDAERWGEEAAVVRRPVATRQIAPGETVVLKGTSGAEVQCRYEDDTISVTAQSDAAASASLLTVEPVDSEARTLLRLSAHETVQHATLSDEDLLLRLYE